MASDPADLVTAERLAAVQRWFLRVGLFLLPLAYTWDTYDGWVLPKLLVARVLLVGLLLLFAARALTSGTVVVKRTPLDLPLAVFLGSALVSTVGAANLNVAIFGTYERYDGLLTLVTYAGLFWLAVHALEGPADARAMLRTLLASAYVAASVAIVMWANASLQNGDSSHAYGTLGHWSVLGAFMGMAWPLALWELVAARTASGRLLALNAVIVVGIALLLTFSRSAWVGGLLGTVCLLAGNRAWRTRRVIWAGSVTAVVIALLVGGLAVSGSQLANAVADRAQTILHPNEWGPRTLIWQGSLKVIESRPIAGYGPDNFGLVFPRYNDVYHDELIDKAHAETLQIAATQGLVGLAAYAWLLLAFVAAFWRGRKIPGAYGVFGAWLGYQATLQVNFTALGSALPFWIFAAAAMHVLGAVSTTPRLPVINPARGALSTVAAALVAVSVVGVVLPYVADSSLLTAVQADYSGRRDEAEPAAHRARLLVPRESVYAVEVGNIAFERGDWARARDAYRSAAELGTYNASVYRNLAVADGNLGLLPEARSAAQAAYELNRTDPANQALLAQFGGLNA